MAAGINSILNIGNNALSGSQAALQTTGNNIANVNTEGYSRQHVRFEAYRSIDFFPGQMGQGAFAAEVLRSFDKFVERNYLDSSSDTSYYKALNRQMQSIESVFNESKGLGINNSLNEFFNSWEKLTQFPDDLASRSALLGQSNSLSSSIRTAMEALQKAQERADQEVVQQVDQTNQLTREIAELTRQINMSTISGRNNPNSLLDERDRKVRELSQLVDIDVVDRGPGNYRVNTKAGQVLVDNTVPFELNYGGPMVFQNTSNRSDVQLGFNGKDGYEYTVKVVEDGDAGTTPPTAAKFKVSLDGGKTWVKSPDGKDTFTASSSDEPVKVKELELYFSDPAALKAGDSFTVSPKNTLYYIEPTMGPLSVNPTVGPDGSIDPSRITGGAIAGNLIFRDHESGKALDQLNTFAKELIWQVNRIHSQGSGLTPMGSATGTYAVRKTDVPLGSSASGLPWEDRLQEGNFSISVYDPATGKPLVGSGGSAVAIDINFDPATESLDDLVAKFGNAEFQYTDQDGQVQFGKLGDFMTALVTADGKLKLEGKTDPVTGKNYSFGLGNDTSGVLAGLGINTFFDGVGAQDIKVRTEVANDSNRINAGRINGAGQGNAGDSLNAREIAKLASTKVDIKDWTGKSTNQTLSAFYAALVSGVGSATAASKSQAASSATVTQELEDRQNEVAGVNLDEEMSNLIRFQASYKAAAKLITTADQMLQTLLSLKQ